MGSCMSSPRRADHSCDVPAAAAASTSPQGPQAEISELLSAASQSRSVSGKVLALAGQPDYLDPRAWTDGLDVPVIKARATALEKGLDTVLNPLLDELERLLDEGCLLGEAGRARSGDGAPAAESGRKRTTVGSGGRAGGQAAAAGGQKLNWDSVQLSHLPALVERACSSSENQFGSPGSIREATAGMLRVLHAICVAGERAELPVPPALLEISSLNRLLGLAGRVVARSVAAEPKEAAAQRWAEWLAVGRQLGLREAHLAVALSAPSKALMISMHMATRYGSGRVAFRVRAEAAFTDALRQAQQMALLDMTAGGIIVYASFAPGPGGEATPRDAPTRASADAADEACARRQAFFERAGRQMLQQAEEPEAEVASTASDGEEGGSQVRRQELFVRMRAGGRHWFNTALRRAPELELAYRFAGWLLGQGFANRASLRVALPDVLFEKLLKGPSFQATMETLSEFDAELAASVRGALHVHSRDYRCQLAREACPPDMSRRSFVRWKVKQALVTDVEWQFAALSQGFYTAVDRESLRFWRVTPSDLAELAAGGPLDALSSAAASGCARGQAAAAVQVDARVQPHAATTNEPVVNTLWKGSPVTHVEITAQASFRTFSGLMHTASGTVMV